MVQHFSFRYFIPSCHTLQHNVTGRQGTFVSFFWYDLLTLAQQPLAHSWGVSSSYLRGRKRLLCYVSLATLCSMKKTKASHHMCALDNTSITWILWKAELAELR